MINNKKNAYILQEENFSVFLCLPIWFIYLAYRINIYRYTNSEKTQKKLDW